MLRARSGWPPAVPRRHGHAALLGDVLGRGSAGAPRLG
ncbi:hypothetical protein AF72_12430 [Xylella taiwanensis]|uniref:Uncharacterized protein n=1 Tax=Xylella taiwanensis TaxID=1444770 RepID=Z9JG22_9GAMM|nr:hypothetical protein AF72_12430 [Xylella taiwanensis]